MQGRWLARPALAALLVLALGACAGGPLAAGGGGGQPAGGGGGQPAGGGGGQPAGGGGGQPAGGGGGQPAGGGGSGSPALGAGGGLAGGAGFAEGVTLLHRTDAELAWELDGIAAAGASYVRLDVDWWLVQPTPTTWNWGPIDRVVDAARARGLRVLGMIGYSPPWARPAGAPDKTPPADPATYAAFARAAVERYAPRGVRDWEIWNEPNLNVFWKPAPNAAEYTALLKQAYTAIKAVDPGATVMTGGLSPAANSGGNIAPVTFLEGIYANGGKGHFDAVAHHPSNYPYMPLKPEANYNYNAFGGVTPMLRQTMVAQGDADKRIWATEMGAPTVQGMTPEYVAAYITEAFTAWKSWEWTGPLFWYSYRDGWSNPTDPEANFGLVRTDGSPKGPALSAFITAVG